MGFLDGLFGSKKPDRTAKVSDFFSEEDLGRIVETVGAKVSSGGYGSKYDFMAEALLSAALKPDTTLTAKELGKADGLLFAIGGMTKLEPSLKPILTAAIEKMRAFRKG